MRNNRAAKKQTNSNCTQKEKKQALDCKLTKTKTKLASIQISSIYAEAARDKAKEKVPKNTIRRKYIPIAPPSVCEGSSSSSYSVLQNVHTR